MGFALTLFYSTFSYYYYYYYYYHHHHYYYYYYYYTSTHRSMDICEPPLLVMMGPPGGFDPPVQTGEHIDDVHHYWIEEDIYRTCDRQIDIYMSHPWAWMDGMGGETQEGNNKEKEREREREVVIQYYIVIHPFYTRGEGGGSHVLGDGGMY